MKLKNLHLLLFLLTFASSTAFAASAITSPAPGSVLPGSSVTFSWSATSGTTQYQLQVGTTLHSNNLNPGSCAGTATSCTVKNLPTNGSTVYVDLGWQVSGKWSVVSSTYATGSSASPTLTGLSCANGTMTGAGTDSCTVTLSAAALSGGYIVNLSSSSSTVSVPTSVTVSSGATSAGFTATVSSFTSSQSVTLTASNGSVSTTTTLLLSASGGGGGGNGGHSYTTSFPSTQNPILEGGNWVGGSSAGGSLWGNVQTTGGSPGFAFGVSEPTQYGDPTAIVTGTWGPNQTVTGTVKINTTPSGTCCHEIELRLRMTISSNSITGYEAYCSVMPSQPYCHVARWNGRNGSYCNIEASGPSTYLVNNDVFKATITGTSPTVITVYRNGTQIMQATDTGQNCSPGGAAGPFTTGNPGMGFYDNQDNNWSFFGWQAWSADDGTAGGSSSPNVQLNWTPPASGTVILLKAQVASSSDCGSVSTWTQISQASGASSYADNSVVAGYYCYGLIVNNGGAYSAVSNIVAAEVTASGGTTATLSAPVPVNGASSFGGNIGTQ